MSIFNRTKKTILSTNASYASTWTEKVKGLTGRNKISPLIFKTRFGIHTFGMKSSLDIIILNKDKKITVIKEDIKPKRIFLWNPLYSFVIELPHGILKKTNTSIGDLIEIS